MAQAQGNSDRRTWGRRCKLGCESWPDTLEFARCLKCGEPTTRYSNLTPMAAAEALSLLRHARFNAFYAKRCEKLSIPAAGPLPEWYEDSLGPLPERLFAASSPPKRA